MSEGKTKWLECLILCLVKGDFAMDMKEIIAENLRNVRLQHGWTQEFVANQLQISQRTVSRAENGAGLSKDTMKRLCNLYQISMQYLYEEEHEESVPLVNIIPEEVALQLLMKNSFVNDLQSETVRRYNDKVSKEAIMTRDDVEVIIDKYMSGRRTFTLSDVIQCGMLVNQSTIHNVVAMLG